MHEILLIEDSENDALLLKRALQAVGVKNPIRHLWNGTEAVSYLAAVGKKNKNGFVPAPAIILLDLKLPDISGFEILALVQQRKSLSKTLRVVLSQYSDLQSIKSAYALGGHSFLTKPAGRQELEELIKTFPEYWQLGPEDKNTHTDRVLLTDSGLDKNCHELFAQNRDAIVRLKADLANLREQLNDNEETFAVIDSIVDEFRESLGAPPSKSPTRGTTTLRRKPELNRN